MTDKEAAEILGINVNASENVFIQAHGRLIQRLHADQHWILE